MDMEENHVGITESKEVITKVRLEIGYEALLTYFLGKMNEEDCPSFHITKQEKARLRRPWKQTLIVKLLGRTLEFKFFERRLRLLWKSKSAMDIVTIDNDFYLVKFSSIDNFNFALFEDRFYKRSIGALGGESKFAILAVQENEKAQIRDIDGPSKATYEGVQIRDVDGPSKPTSLNVQSQKEGGLKFKPSSSKSKEISQRNQEATSVEHTIIFGQKGKKKSVVVVRNGRNERLGVLNLEVVPRTELNVASVQLQFFHNSDPLDDSNNLSSSEGKDVDERKES
ncbi:conserved hypothetical protein [Ricinus communis]|uniref:DUF4283 domain-containing protein n=1 Tax=Ricinus communis TaxID=3988 RepID=B9T894_RICCO|nr:conserved hypothetical protein [Ricinus communis]